MSRVLFPAVTPQVDVAAGTASELPLCRDVQWDFEHDRPLMRRGNPVYVTGLEAVISWAYRALRVVRYRYPMYSTDYGAELETLIGQPYTGELKASEAIRFVRDALTIYPYITEVQDIGATFEGGLLEISCLLVTIYGEVTLRV